MIRQSDRSTQKVASQHQAKVVARRLRDKFASWAIHEPTELGLDVQQNLALGDTPWNALYEAGEQIRAFFHEKVGRDPTYAEVLVPFLQVFGSTDRGWQSVARQFNVYVYNTLFDPERIIKQAGWWAISPDDLDIKPPPVYKGGLMNAFPGTDPADAALYNGDGPADLMSAALDDIDLEYRRTWGRPAKPDELKAVFEFVFRPVESGDVKLNEEMDKVASAEDGKKTGDRKGVGFFIPLPADLAAKFPDRGPEDKSPPHTTFLYVGDVPKDQEDKFLATARDVFLKIREPVRAHLKKVDYFTQPGEGSRVAVLPIQFSSDMAAVRWNLRDALQDAGFQVDDSFPLVYRPHTTLAYLDGLDTEYDGLVPQGQWEFDSIEVWGLPKVHTISFGSGQARKVAKRYIDAMTDEASRALMGFLSEVARRLGVGQHVYVVGGAVRNFVIDQPVKDIDIVIDSLALGGKKDSEWFAKKLQQAIPVPTSVTVNNYGVALLNIKGDWKLKGVSLQGEDIEIANARKESYGGETGKGYKPHMVEPATIDEDIQRREFTFNTLLWRLQDLAKGPDKAEIIDLTGCGLKDLQEGMTRCPRPPDEVFSDDPSRMIRAVKFLLKYGLKIAPDVEASIRKNKGKLKNIPSSHLSSMLINVFFEGGVGKAALLEMKRLGLLDVVKDIAQKDKGFRKTLANWADKSADLQFLFDLMDFGMPSGRRLQFLNPRQIERVREITVQMDAKDADFYVSVLAQPGKTVDTRALMQEFGLKGRDVSRIQDAARLALLDDPILATSPKRLTDKVRKALGGQARVARKEQIPGGLAKGKKPSDFDQKALAKGTKVEMEHTEDETVAQEIAMDHLTEDPDYYDKLEKIERHAKKFDIPVGTPVVYGKYKNKKGIVKGFKTDSKGDVVVIVEPVPKGRKQDKELKLFKIRPDEDRMRKSHAVHRVVARYLAKVLLPTARWIEAKPSQFDEHQRETIWHLYDISYGNVGQHISGLSQLLGKYEIFWLVDIDGDDTIDAFIAYKKTRFGKKLALLGSDGSPAAKRAAVAKAIQLLKFSGWYAELSGRPAQIMESAGIPKVDSEELVRRILPTDIEWLGDGRYKRQIGGLGSLAKSIYGRPKVARQKLGASADAVHTVLIQDGNILMLKRGPTAPWMAGVWDFPGGHVDSGESAKTAAIRECREETNLSPKSLKIFRKYTDPDGYNMVVYTAASFGGSLKVSREHSEAKWVPLEKASSYQVIPGMGQTVRMLQQKYGQNKSASEGPVYVQFRLDDERGKPVGNWLVPESSIPLLLDDTRLVRKVAARYLQRASDGDAFQIGERVVYGPMVNEPEYWSAVALESTDHCEGDILIDSLEGETRTDCDNVHSVSRWQQRHPGKTPAGFSRVASVVRSNPGMRIPSRYPQIGGTTHDADGIPLKDHSIFLQTRPRYGVSLAALPKTGSRHEIQMHSELVDILSDPNNHREIVMRDSNVVGKTAKRKTKPKPRVDDKDAVLEGHEPEYIRLMEPTTVRLAHRVVARSRKQPWQMTLKEFAQTDPQAVVKRRPMTFDEWLKLEHVNPRDVASEFEEASFLGGVLFQKPNPTRREQGKLKALHKKVQYRQRLREQYEKSVAPQKSYRSLSPSLSRADQAALRVLHKREIRKALRAGKRVPAKVLAEYPELKIKQAVIQVAARYQKKKEVPKAKGKGTTTVYEYSDRQVQHRNREKAKKVEKLRKRLSDLQAQVKKDIKSKDPKKRLTALAVGLINDTYERVGNEESAEDGHFGVTQWRVNHVTLGNGKATFKYVGKSGVNQTKETRDADLIKVLREAVKEKGKDDPIFELDEVSIDNSDVNSYLKPFGITAKDIRGLHANRVMQKNLKSIRGKGGKLPDDKKERDAKLKEEFNKALEQTADEVGHKPSTLKSQYLVPGLEDNFLRDGTVKPKLDKQAIIHIDHATDGYPDDAKLRGVSGLISSLTWFEQAVVLDMMVHGASILRTDTGDGYPVGWFLRGHRVPDDIVAELVGAGYLEWEDDTHVRLSDMFEAKKRLYTATKSQAEKEEEEALRLVRPLPKKKPPRKDLRRERIEQDDDETETQGADKDRDLSLNYKRVASRWLARIAGKVPHDKKPKDKGDYWQTPTGSWGVFPPGQEQPTSAPNEERAKAMAEGAKKEPGEEPEDEDVEEKQQEQKKRRRKEYKDALGNFESFVKELDDPSLERQLSGVSTGEVDTHIEKAHHEIEKLQAKLKDPNTKEDDKKGIKQQIEDIQADIENLESKRDKLADIKRNMVESYQTTLDELQDRLYGVDGEMSADVIEEVSKAYSGSPARDARPKELGKFLARKALAQRVLANPTIVGGVKVTNEPKSPEELTKRAKQALDQYIEVSPDLRQEAARQAQDRLEELDEYSPEHRELERILDGLYMAASIKDEVLDVRGERIRPPMAKSWRTLAEKLHNKGDIEVMMGTLHDFSSPTGRDKIRDALDTMSSEEVVTFVGGEDGDYKEVVKAINDPDVGPEQKAYLVDFLKRSTLNDISTGHQVLVDAADVAWASKQKMTPQEVQETLDKIHDEVRGSQNMKSALAKFTRCMQNATTQKEIDSCKKLAANAEIQQISEYLKRAEKTFGELPKDHPVAAQIRKVIETGDLSELQKKYVKQQKSGQKLPCYQKLFNVLSIS